MASIVGQRAIAASIANLAAHRLPLETVHA
jgi:hypothetical protein